VEWNGGSTRLLGTFYAALPFLFIYFYLPLAAAAAAVRPLFVHL